MQQQHDPIRPPSQSEKQYPIIPTCKSPIDPPRAPSETNRLPNQELQKTFAQYTRLMREHTVLNNQLVLIEKEQAQLQERYIALRNEQEDKKKRHRRTAGQIARNFKCPVDPCGKSYGSEGSLLQHIKLKHVSFYNSEEYERLLMSKPKKGK